MSATRDVFVEVLLELTLAEVAGAHDPSAMILERLRDAADRRCRDAGAELRTDRAPEVLVKQATTISGVGMVLVASRWSARAPEGVELKQFPTPRGTGGG